MKVKLAQRGKIDFQDLENKTKIGGRFVVYQWIIPLPFFIPIKRLSKVFFIDTDSKPTKYALRFNTLNLLIGWWGLPFGPIYLINSIRFNLKGGLDVTDDILLNAKEQDYNNGVIDIKEHANKFEKPNKSELRALKKISRNLIRDKFLTDSPIVGYFVDVEMNEEPYYVIGIKDIISEDLEMRIQKEIYKRFYKSFNYILVNLDIGYDYEAQLIKQGIKITVGNIL